MPQSSPEYDAKYAFEQVKNFIGNSAGEFAKNKINKKLSEESPIGIEDKFSGRVAQIIEDAVEQADNSNTEILKKYKISVSAKSIKPTSQEKYLGADLAIFFEVLDKKSKPVISKTLLIQAKNGVYRKGPPPSINISDERVEEQILKINSVTPSDGYVLVYTESGAFCMEPKTAFLGINGNTINSHHFDKVDVILKKLFECKSGTRDIVSPAALNAKRVNGRLDINDAANKLSYHAQILLENVVSIEIYKY